MIERQLCDARLIAEYMEQVPFAVDPKGLYTAQSLYDRPDLAECYDQRVYRHYLDSGKVTDNAYEALARNLHDFCIMQHLRTWLATFDKHRVVAVMGGNAMHRNEAAYEKIARISKMLTEQGALMVSGGGSGAMEATGFGAWMAGRSEAEFGEALACLASVPSQETPGYMDVAFDLIRRYPQSRFESLSIPTWLYGHELTSPFATRIAKLFENSVREDTLLTVAYGGIIFAPGRAGTIQEVFQEAVQNHYLTYGLASPMVFLDTEFWTVTTHFYPLLLDLVKKGFYKNLLLSLTDDPEEAVRTIQRFCRQVEEEAAAGS